MQHYTVQDILALRPCQPTEYDPDAGYPEDKLRVLFGDRQSVTALDICDDERVPIEDRQWVLHRLLPEQIVNEVACRYAEHALKREQKRGYEPDPRSWAAIEAKRQWLRGEISDGELEAAESAAWAAADAVSDARTSRAAASAAVWAAARDAARAAAKAAEGAEGAAKCAASAVAWSAANAATVWDVARSAERRWQLATLRAMIGEMEDRTHQRKGKQ